MATTYEMTDKLGFEVRTCGRCGGTGRHSFNQITRDVCFGCNGKGKQFTARGREAHRMFCDSLMVPAGELQIGQTLFNDGMFTKPHFGIIVSIEDDTLNPGMITIKTKHPKYGDSGLGCQPKHTVRRGWSLEAKQEKLAAALAYQDSLTKGGKPRKGRAA